MGIGCANDVKLLRCVGSKTYTGGADLETQKVRTYMMVDEVRAAHDLPSLPDGLGQVINDPNWMQARRDLMLQQQLLILN